MFLYVHVDDKELYNDMPDEKLLEHVERADSLRYIYDLRTCDEKNNLPIIKYVITIEFYF